MRKVVAKLLVLLAIAVAFTQAEDLPSSPDESAFRAIEEERLRGLVDAEMASFDKFHAHDYQLISPSGLPFTYRSYRDAISSGQLDYSIWEIGGTFQARIHPNVAILRYQAKLQFAWEGKKRDPIYLWHTDVYEKRDGRWLVVWSQATQIN